MNTNPTPPVITIQQYTWVFIAILLTAYASLVNFFLTPPQPAYGVIFIVFSVFSLLILLLMAGRPALRRWYIFLLMFQGLPLAMAGYSYYHVGKSVIPHIYVVAGTAYFVLSGLKALETYSGKMP